MTTGVDSPRIAPRRRRVRRKSHLAAYGGVPAVPPGSYVPWPAAAPAHAGALQVVIDSGRYHRVNHPVVVALENAFRSWTGGLWARAVSSGTAALHIALDAQRDRGSEVLAAALNWPGAVGPISICGLEPKFVDVSLDDACMDEDAARSALPSGGGTILVTHLFGNAAPLPALRAEADVRGMGIIDDCAQAVTMARALADRALPSSAAAVSGNGAKHLGAGELGILVSRDQSVIEHVDRVSLSSSSRNGERVFSPLTQGFNYRPNPFSAAIALHRVGELDGQIATRRRNAARLYARLSALPGLRPLFRPEESLNSFCSFALRIDPAELDLPMHAATRDFITDLLAKEGVPAGVWLRRPVWEYLPAWRGRFSLDDFPNTRRLLDTMLYVPEVAPPNDETTMDRFAGAFEKVWAALPALRDDAVQAVRGAQP